MKYDLIRPINFETGETIYFDPNELQKGNLIQITKEEADKITSTNKMYHGVVSSIDIKNKTITIK